VYELMAIHSPHKFVGDRYRAKRTIKTTSDDASSTVVSVHRALLI
jgi:hypothetical protein